MCACYYWCCQSTAVVTYRQSSERPLSCSLQSLEVFSCSLAAEAETALSIIDPMSLSVELNSNPAEQERKLGPGTSGLLDVAIADERLPILEVKLKLIDCLRATHWMPPDYWQTDNSNGLVMVIRNYHWLNSASRVLRSTCSTPLVQTGE